ncbi:MAG TPA: ribosomal protein S18-alanine N-acetyltransferase [Nitrososphaerales archaeon]|nr:ribosomal protein S18-alanine N-acetyltransferase [Nitrososphaerales archaeon]
MSEGLPVEVRDCEQTDLARVEEIENASFPDPYSHSLFLQLLLSYPRGFRVAEIEGQLVGYCILVDPKDNDLKIIASIAVDPACRGRGIGSALLEDAITRARIARIVLQVRVDNLAAISLYEKFGFIKTARIADYYGEGEDAFEMLFEAR